MSKNNQPTRLPSHAGSKSQIPANSQRREAKVLRDHPDDRIAGNFKEAANGSPSLCGGGWDEESFAQIWRYFCSNEEAFIFPEYPISLRIKIFIAPAI
jgi:hypothetical protein